MHIVSYSLKKDEKILNSDHHLLETESLLGN